MEPALVYPLNRTDYLGEIHFAPIIETPTAPDALTNQSASGELARTNGFLLEDIVAFSGGLSSVESQSNGYVQRNGRKCILYLPQSIMITDGATYNNVDLGTIGAVVEGAFTRNRGESVNIDSFIANMRGMANMETAKLMGNAVVKAIAPDNIVAAVRSQTRVTTNPNTRTLFESVPIREFTFAFKMIPKSADEALAIKNIIKFFRSEIYPSEIPGKVGNISFSLGYRFPNRFNIEMMYNGVPVATKIKPCYLRNLTTTYNSSTMGMFYDGNFLETDLTLTFVEGNALSRSDVVDRGY